MRRTVIASLFLCLTMLSGCGRSKVHWHADNITGAMPNLKFLMRRANDGAHVTAADYRGKVVLLYFGYTNCPDICPTTLANLADMLVKLGGDARKVRVLFVTVDPNRDTLSVLKQYTKAFAPQLDGLRGSDSQIATLARSYHESYSVTPASPGHPYTVSHSSAVFFFDPKGRARLVSLSTNDTQGLADDVKHLLDDD
jgi:protein SCO1/2